MWLLSVYKSRHVIHAQWSHCQSHTLLRHLWSHLPIGVCLPLPILRRLDSLSAPRTSVTHTYRGSHTTPSHLSQATSVVDITFQPYKEDNQVWLEGTNLKTLYPTAKLGPKWYGPFKVVKQLSNTIYQLEIPWQWKIHNVFHANLLTPYKEMELHRPNFTQPPCNLINGEPEYEVEKIIDVQPRGQGHKMHFLVKWKGYHTSDNSWEPQENLHCYN